ncbi:hypothetical protein IU443_28465 [Nocardia farcinica]|uniref:hypothetical protein n=1 Tax=Nocardia farcinica TaxID=37329 RepID=UPI00189368D3|nr:hypothetical protein [Nocardia farcinica]MBF6393866.1 hypothetical protein [Nocardia farcinica]
MNPIQVGTVEILNERVYPLDANSDRGSEVFVPPGTYPVYRDCDTFFWVMTGRINGRGCYKIGDGLYELNPGDSARGPKVQFPSPTFGADAFAHFLANDPICQEGPTQRLRFHLAEEAAA